jgi:hypothetical protein
MLGLALVSFSPTFYLRGLVKAPVPPAGPLPAYLIVHGIVMTAWYLLFLMQAWLAATRRIALHRRAGQLAGWLAAAVVLTGVYAALSMPARIIALGAPAGVLFQFHIDHIVIGDLLTLSFFSALVAAALLLRYRRPWHGRLLFLAFLMSLGPVFGGGGTRLLGPLLAPFVPSWLPAYHLLAGFLALLIRDFVSSRRVHPATLIGFAAAAVPTLLEDVAVTSEAGQALFRSLFSP